MNEREQSEKEDYQRECDESIKNHYQNPSAMKDIKGQFLDVIEKNVKLNFQSNTQKRFIADEAASKCAELSKGMMIAFAEWISRNKWYEQSVNSYWCKDGVGKMDAITTSELYDLFLSQYKPNEG
jgi:hypothetical protein